MIRKKAIYLLFIIPFFSCKKENLTNQVGTWKGKKIQETFEKGLLVRKYEDIITLELKADNTGLFREFSTDDTVYWNVGKENNKIFVSILSDDPLFGRQFTDFLFDIKTDKADSQIWEREQTLVINLTTNEKRKIVDRWELKK
jgi:uncharacterized protein (DUF736 family)